MKYLTVVCLPSGAFFGSPATIWALMVEIAEGEDADTPLIEEGAKWRLRQEHGPIPTVTCISSRNDFLTDFPHKTRSRTV